MSVVTETGAEVNAIQLRTAGWTNAVRAKDLLTEAGDTETYGDDLPRADRLIAAAQVRATLALALFTAANEPTRAYSDTAD